MSVKIRILDRGPHVRGHKLGVPGEERIVPEPLARALVKRGEAVYSDSAQPVDEIEAEEARPESKKAKKASKPAKKASKGE